MDYRVIDTLQNQLQGLTVEVERRHALIAAKNETREDGTPEIKRNILADATIQEHTAKIAKEARPVLLETLSTVEAGETLPDFVRKFVDNLNDIAALLSYDTAATKIWQTQAGELLTCIATYRAQGNALREPRYYLPTEKSQEDLARIFHDLAKGKYIDATLPEALRNFLNAFASSNPGAQEAQSTAPQARITWIWKARNGQVSPMQILDFAIRMTGRPNNAIPQEFYNTVAAIFGVNISRGVKDRYWRQKTEISEDLERIINKPLQQ